MSVMCFEIDQVVSLRHSVTASGHEQDLELQDLFGNFQEPIYAALESESRRIRTNGICRAVRQIPSRSRGSHHPLLGFARSGKICHYH